MSPRQSLKPTADTAGVAANAASQVDRPQMIRPSPAGEMPQRPETSDAKPAATPGAPAAATARPKRRMVGPIIGVVALLAAIGYGTYWWTTARFLVSTDDAYIGANIALVSARIPARVAEVMVDANQKVAVDQPLIRLDDGDYRLAAAQAKARLATQETTVLRYGKQIQAAQAAVAQARAQREAADADLIRAKADFERTETLATRRDSSQATLDAARAARDKAIATVAAAHAGVLAAQSNVAVLEAQQTEARHTALEFKVSVDKAQRDLEGTVIRAPLDGILGNRSVQVGDYVTPGKRLAAIVPMAHVFLDANFKETQLARLEVGQTAHVTVDAADGQSFDGEVAGIAPASGSQFSLLPPENATGNFTKIVQRVPVRIRVPRAMIERGVLRPGLSVVVTVDTRTGHEQSIAPSSSPAVASPIGHRAARQRPACSRYKPACSRHKVIRP